MKVARVSHLAGFVGTSNVMAGKAYGIPIVGTMAHSFISSFEHEIDAFRAYVRSFPHNAILLIDTYDTLQGARNAVQIAKEMATRGETLIGVRLDSGDLADLARQVRKIFDDANLPGIKIIGSGGLDEYDLAELAEAHAGTAPDSRLSTYRARSEKVAGAGARIRQRLGGISSGHGRAERRISQHGTGNR